MSPYERWPELRSARQPSKIWRLIVAREPQLAAFEKPCRSFSATDLIARLESIMRAVADRGGTDRGGFSFEDAERLETAAADARTIVHEIASGRKPPSAEPELTFRGVEICAACWRLAAITTQRGFRSDGNQALCGFHSPAAAPGNTTSLAAARTRMRKIRKMPPRDDRSLTVIANLFAYNSDAEWSGCLSHFFPRVSFEHPRARASILAAFRELDELDPSPERERLHQVLARSPTWGATLLHGMLTTRELWLRVENDNFHGGRRAGAGRPNGAAGKS